MKSNNTKLIAVKVDFKNAQPKKALPPGCAGFIFSIEGTVEEAYNFALTEAKSWLDYQHVEYTTLTAADLTP